MKRTAMTGFAERHRGLGVAVVLAVALGGCAAPSAPGSAVATGSSPVAPGPAPSARTDASPDFDGDGGADLAVGTGTDPGRVSIRYANGATLDVGRGDVDSDPAHAASADFGQALLARDLNGDGFTDLVVSDPGAEFGTTLFLLYGGPKGLDLADPVTIPVDAAGSGRALALVESPSPVLVAAGGGGSVLTWRLGTDGRPIGGPTSVSPESLGLAAPAAGSRFGSSLASSGSLLVIGAPGETVNGARQAGAVYLVDVGTNPVQAQRITEATRGVPGDARTGNRFGAAVAASGALVVVGVPGESRKDARGRSRAGAGMLVVLEFSAGSLSSATAYDQLGLRGRISAGDGFGSTLAMVRPCRDTVGVIAGAWAEAVGADEQAGSVWLIPLGEAGCAPVQLRDGHGLAAKAGPNTVVGSAVSALRAGSDGDTLVIAAQGNSEEGVPGRVLTLDYPYTDPPAVVFTDLAVKEERTIALSPPEG